MGLVVGEVDQRIMVHQAEVMATLGDVVVPMQAGGGGSSYRNGTDFSGLTGGNSNDSLCTNK